MHSPTPPGVKMDAPAHLETGVQGLAVTGHPGQAWMAGRLAQMAQDPVVAHAKTAQGPHIAALHAKTAQGQAMDSVPMVQDPHIVVAPAKMAQGQAMDSAPMARAVQGQEAQAAQWVVAEVPQRAARHDQAHPVAQ